MPNTTRKTVASSTRDEAEFELNSTRQAPKGASKKGGASDEAQVFEELTKATRKLLLEYVATATMVKSHYLSRDNFQKLARFAYDQKIVTPDELGALGMADRSTASRWISGLSAPSPLTQSIIIGRLADRAKQQADELTASTSAGR